MARAITSEFAPATQTTVAKLAGVSRQSVSMALRGGGTLAQQTRSKILKAAEDLGYHPDLHVEARRLTARNSGRRIPLRTLGLVWSVGMQKVSEETSFYRALLDGIMRACWEHHQALTILNLRADEAQNLSFVAHVDGLIVPDVLWKSNYQEAARRLGKALVTVGQELDGVADVGFDQAEAIRLAFRHLWEKGHRKIGMIGPAIRSNLTPDVSQRWMAYCECLQEAGLSYQASYVVLQNDRDGSNQYSFRTEGAKNMRKLWAQTDRPSALVAYNDLMALGVLDAAAELGVAVPGELSVVSIDDIEEAARATPALTTVATDIQGMGFKAAQLLEEFARTGTYQPERIRMKLELKERASVKAIAG